MERMQTLIEEISTLLTPEAYQAYRRQLDKLAFEIEVENQELSLKEGKNV